MNKNINILEIIPFKRINDGMIMSRISYRYGGGPRNIYLHAPYFIRFLPSNIIDVPNNIKSNMIPSFLLREIYNEALQPTVNNRMCPFCGSCLFKHENNLHCLNLKCVDIKQSTEFLFDKLFKLLDGVNEQEFNVLIEKFNIICATYGTVEFSVINFYNMLYSEYLTNSVPAEHLDFYISVLDKIKGISIRTLFSMCGFPYQLSDSISTFTDCMDNSIHKLKAVMDCNQFDFNISYEEDKRYLNEYLRFVLLSNKDLIEFICKL